MLSLMVLLPAVVDQLSLLGRSFNDMTGSLQRLLVEQKSPVLVAHLAAVALEPAALGQLLRVRLRAGANAEAGTNGPVIQVEAAGPGLARWNAGVSR